MIQNKVQRGVSFKPTGRWERTSMASIEDIEAELEGVDIPVESYYEKDVEENLSRT